MAAKKEPTQPEVVSKETASRKIQEVAKTIHADITKTHKKPTMRFPIRSLSNVKYDVKQGHFEMLGKTSTNRRAPR